MKRLALLLAAIGLSLTGLAAIPSKVFTIELAPDGSLYSRYPDGQTGAACTWDTIPDISVANGSIGSVDLRSEYLTGSGCSSATVTLSCATPLPSGGFSFSAPTLSWSGTTTGTNACTASAEGASSNQFLLQSSGDDADETAPLAPSLSVSNIGTTTATLSILPLNDVYVAGETCSGLKDYTVSVNGTPVASNVAISTPGLCLPLQSHTLGNASSVTTSRDGSSISFTLTSGDWYDTLNGVAWAPAESVGGSLDVIAYVPSFSHGNQWAKVGVGLLKEMAANAQGAWTVLFPSSPGNGFNLEHHLTTGANGTQDSRVSGVTAPQCVRVNLSGNTLTSYSSPDCNNWVQRQSRTIGGFSGAVYPIFYAGQTGGSSMSVQLQRVSVNNVAPITVNLTGLTEGAANTVSVTVRDNANNTSSAASVTVTTTSSGGGSGGGSGAREYPLLGAYAIGGYVNNTAIYCTNNFEQWARKLDFVVINTWDGYCGSDWGPSIGNMTNSLLDTGTEVYTYFNSQQGPASAGGAADEIYQKFTNMKWWLYNSYPNGTPVPGFWGSGYRMFASYVGGPTDAQGYTWSQWYMRYVLDVARFGGAYGLTNGGNSAAPALTGTFADDVMLSPEVAGDYDRNGSSNSTGDQSIWPNFRLGIRGIHDAQSTFWPEGKKSANCSRFYDAAMVAHRSEFLGYYDLCVMEGALGESWSAERYHPFSTVRGNLERAEAALKEGGSSIFVHQGILSNGADCIDSTAYRAVKYGFAFSQIMGHAYYAAPTPSCSGGNPTDISYNSLTSQDRWFDYYSVNTSGQATTQASATASTRKWLGEPLGPYQILSGTGSQGIHIRFFEHGFCAINPHGNGTQSLTTSHLGGSGVFKRIQGLQDTSTDNGATITGSISMPARSGICGYRL